MCFQVFKFHIFFCRCFLLFCTFFTKVLSGLTLKFYKSENKFSLPFHFLNYFFCFLLKAQNCIKTCVNCVTPLFTPLEIHFSKIIFFKNYFFPHLKCWTCSKGDNWKLSMRRIMGYLMKIGCKSFYMAKWTLI